MAKGSRGGGSGGGGFGKLPQIEGASEKQIKYAEDLRKGAINTVESFEQDYAKIRNRLMDSESGAVSNYFKEKAEQAGQNDIERSKAQNRFEGLEYTIKENGGVFRGAGLGREYTPEFEAHLESAKKSYKGELVGKRKDRLPGTVANAIEIDYALKNIKKQIRNEKSARAWIDQWK